MSRFVMVMIFIVLISVCGCNNGNAQSNNIETSTESDILDIQNKFDEKGFVVNYSERDCRENAIWQSNIFIYR